MFPEKVNNFIGKDSYCWNIISNEVGYAFGCYLSKCSLNNDYIKLFYKNQSFKCYNEGDIIFINDSEVLKIFCNTIKLREKKILNLERVPFSKDKSHKHKKNEKSNDSIQWSNIIITCTIVFNIIYAVKEEIESEDGFQELV